MKSLPYDIPWGANPLSEQNPSYRAIDFRREALSEGRPNEKEDAHLEN